MPESQEKSMYIRSIVSIMDAELEKDADKIDTALLAECDEWLKWLESDGQELSDAELTRKYDCLMSRINPFADVQSNIGPKQSHPGKLKKAFVAAIAAALMLISLTVVCFAVPGIRDWILSVARMNNGSVIEVDGITYEHNGQLIVYKDKEDLCKAAGISFIVPTDSSGRILLERVMDVSGEQESYVLQYSDQSSIMISGNETRQTDSSNPSITIGSYVFYLYTKDVETPTGFEKVYGASYFSERYIYTFIAYSPESRDSLIKIFAGE